MEQVKNSSAKISGFTMIELVVVIVLLGILSAFVIPRFVDVDVFRNQAAYDEVAGAVRFAQKLAVVSGCEVRVAFTANSYALQQHATDCTTGAFNTITGLPVTSGTLSGVTLTAPGSIIFDALGRCSSNATITVGGDSFTVVAETGYVNAP